MAADTAVKTESKEATYAPKQSCEIYDDLESVKCVVTFLAEMTFFGAFSGKDGLKISSDGEAGLHAILTGVTKTIDEAIEKIPSGKNVQ